MKDMLRALAITTHQGSRFVTPDRVSALSPLPGNTNTQNLVYSWLNKGFGFVVPVKLYESKAFRNAMVKLLATREKTELFDRRAREISRAAVAAFQVSKHSRLW